MKYDWCITKTTVRAASRSFSSFSIKLYVSSPVFIILWSVLLLEYSSVCNSRAVYIIMCVYLREVLWACANSHLPQVKIVDRANNLPTVFFFSYIYYLYLLYYFFFPFQLTYLRVHVTMKLYKYEFTYCIRWEYIIYRRSHIVHDIIS